jgi:ribonuclease R
MKQPNKKSNQKRNQRRGKKPPGEGGKSSPFRPAKFRGKHHGGRPSRGHPPDSIVLEITAVIDAGEYETKPVDAGSAPAGRFVLHVSREDEKLLKMNALGKGDRVLARLHRTDAGLFEASPIKRMAKPPAHLVGVVEQGPHGYILRGTDRKAREEYDLIKPEKGQKEAVPYKTGDVLVAAVSGPARLGRKQVRVLENLGSFDAPKAVSMIAIASAGIPFAFPELVIAESEKLEAATVEDREDLRKLPLVTIDGADARDFDDAVFAEKDTDPKNPGGWNLIVAIADVSYYVRPGDVLDTEAYKRGNSVYFPDRVVPMLPEAISNELCSLKPKVDRACLAAHMVVNRHGELKRFTFTRGLMRSAARLTYEQVQQAMDGKPDDTTGPLLEPVIKPLYEAYDILLAARKKRGTLDLDIAERQIKIGEDGKVSSIDPRARLDSHKLIEEFMILANVAAATALQEAGMGALYRVHDQPSDEKVMGLKEFLKGFNIRLAPTGALRPIDLAAILEKFVGSEHSPVINEIMLRSQAQAIYSPENIGHFGLALARYAHFTSPIRRYADLIVHRALIRLFRLGKDGLSDHELTRLDEIGEHISKTERRAIEAEREASDRYTSLYLANKIGEDFMGRISGVTRAGLFVRLADNGADGFVPMRTLPHDFYHHDEARHALVGKRSGRTFKLADVVKVRIAEADPVVGGLRFELLDGNKDDDGRHPRQRPVRGEHKGRRRRR